MKTITTVDELDAMSDRAVIKAADEAILFCIGSGQPDWDGNVWQDEESRWLGSSDVELPATLIHPLVFTAEDVERAAEAIFDEETNTADSMDRPTWDQLWDGKDNGKGPYLTLACAVLGAVGSVEA